MDSFHCHQMDSIKKQLCKANAELVVIAGGCTSILQTLAVNQQAIQRMASGIVGGLHTRRIITCVGRYDGKDANGF